MREPLLVFPDTRTGPAFHPSDVARLGRLVGYNVRRSVRVPGVL